MQQTAQQDDREVSNIRQAGAMILDFITAFFASSYLITLATGQAYVMNQKLAYASAAVTIFYFVIGKISGGTLWQRVSRMK